MSSRVGRLFWIATVLALLAVSLPFFHVPYFTTTRVATVVPQIPRFGGPFNNAFATVEPIQAGDSFLGNYSVAVGSTQYGTGQFFVMSEAQYSTYDTTRGEPQAFLYASGTRYIFFGNGTLVFPFNLRANETERYYFVWWQGILVGTGRVSVFDMANSSATLTGLLAGASGGASIILYTANEVGWRRKKRTQVTK